MTEKEKRKAIKKKLREEEMIRYAQADEERRLFAQKRYEQVEIKNMSISDSDMLNALVSKLSGMQLSGDIKLVRGSFSLGSIVEVEFIVKSTGERWLLHCLNDGPMGGGSLQKLP